MPRAQLTQNQRQFLDDLLKGGEVDQNVVEAEPMPATKSPPSAPPQRRKPPTPSTRPNPQSPGPAPGPRKQPPGNESLWKQFVDWLFG